MRHPPIQDCCRDLRPLRERRATIKAHPTTPRRPICINPSPNRGFRRGEGGWEDGWWAFMVARRGSPEDVGSSMNGPYPPSTGDHKGPPNPTSSTLAPTDLRISRGFSYDCCVFPPTPY